MTQWQFKYEELEKKYAELEKKHQKLLDYLVDYRDQLYRQPNQKADALFILDQIITNSLNH